MNKVNTQKPVARINNLDFAHIHAGRATAELPYDTSALKSKVINHILTKYELGAALSKLAEINEESYKRVRNLLQDSLIKKLRIVNVKGGGIGITYSSSELATNREQLGVGFIAEASSPLLSELLNSSGDVFVARSNKKISCKERVEPFPHLVSVVISEMD